MVTGKFIVLGIHNILRWVVLGMGLFSLAKLFAGWFGKKTWKEHVQKSLFFYTVALDSQLLIGSLLYFIFSDLTRAAFSNIRNALSNPMLRFFTLEHALLMILAIIFAHLGNSIGKKELLDDQKFIRVSIMIAISFIFLIAWS